MKIEQIKLKDIVPDNEQPRKFFNELRLKDLRESIKKHGIKSPLIVEDFGNGKYLLIDGERRFRAANDLKLESVPAIIEKPKAKSDRLIEQFHIQEQHEAWNSLERASAVNALVEELKIDLPEIVQLLNLPRATVQLYMAYAAIRNKQEFEKTNIPIQWMGNIISTRNIAKKIYEETEKVSFTRTDEKKFENSLIRNIKEGHISKRFDLAKLGDTFKSKPAEIKKFLSEAEFDLNSKFRESDAAGNNAVRTATYECTYLVGKIKIMLDSKNVKLSEKDKTIFLGLKKWVDTLIDKLDI